MEAAFLLLEAGPAAAAFVATGGRQGAGQAADRAVAAVVQDVVGQAVFLEVGPHLVAAPVDERVELPDVGVVGAGGEREERRHGTLGALIAAHAGDPEVEVEEFLAERVDLAEFAALLRITLPELGAVLGGLLFDGLRREHFLDPDAEVRLELRLELQGLGEEQAGVQRERRERQTRGLGEVQDDHAGGLETRADAGAGAKGLVSPAQTVHWRQRRETGVEFRDAGWVEVGHRLT